MRGQPPVETIVSWNSRCPERERLIEQLMNADLAFGEAVSAMANREAGALELVEKARVACEDALETLVLHERVHGCGI